jgi:hypothetical protein
MPGQSKTLVQDTAQATGLIVGLPWHTALLKARLSKCDADISATMKGRFMCSPPMRRSPAAA